MPPLMRQNQPRTMAIAQQQAIMNYRYSRIAIPIKLAPMSLFAPKPGPTAQLRAVWNGDTGTRPPRGTPAVGAKQRHEHQRNR